MSTTASITIGDKTFQAETKPENTILGLRQNWLSGEDPNDNVEFSLCAGAGLGYPLLTMEVHVDGKFVVETFNVVELAPAWCTAIVERHRAMNDPDDLKLLDDEQFKAAYERSPDDRSSAEQIMAEDYAGALERTGRADW